MDRSGTNPFRQLALVWSLRRVILEEGPDLLLAFTIKPNIYGCSLCRLLGIPAVPTVTGLGTAFLGGPALRRMVLAMYRFAFARARMVFFQNPDDEALFLRERIVRSGQSRVVPGSGIDLDRFRPSELPDQPRFLMIARLLGDKGVREYAEAARELRGRLPSATFALVGELDRDNRSAIGEGELKSWVRDGILDYLGPAEDVRPHIERSMAVVLPSYREGLPRTLLEAAAMGRPVIGTDVPGCRQVVRDGVTGLLCEPRSAESLAAAMERLAGMPPGERGRLGAAARAMAEREFGEKRVTEAYLEVVASLRA
jgi:glycosyltransferase involved in cell wall biosynthesis